MYAIQIDEKMISMNEKMCETRVFRGRVAFLLLNKSMMKIIIIGVRKNGIDECLDKTVIPLERQKMKKQGQDRCLSQNSMSKMDVVIEDVKKASVVASEQ
jgi:hypothetical protein